MILTGEMRSPERSLRGKTVNVDAKPGGLSVGEGLPWLSHLKGIWPQDIFTAPPRESNILFRGKTKKEKTE